MRLSALAASVSLTLAPVSDVAATPAPAAATRDQAQDDALALAFVEELTTEVGQRLAGTDAEARGRAWMVRKLRTLGFSNVHVEQYVMKTWVRGAEAAEIVSPFSQKLAVTALGRSGATPPEGITAEVIGFNGMASLRAAADETVRGKIVFIDHAMQPNQDGSGYFQYAAVRGSGPSLAASKGALAVVIRSLGTGSLRAPHTGLTKWDDGVAPIAAGALSIPDAENLERMLKRGAPVRMHLTLTPRWVGETMSGNVVGEVPGSDPQAGIVLIGGHLDSWDLGTGALDDAAGLAITTVAAKRIMDRGRPRRTIRLVAFGAEEFGGFGSDAYFDAHKDENIVFVAESDFGADRIWSMRINVADANAELADAIAAALDPLGISRAPERAHDGADIEHFFDAGVAGVDLQQDKSRYFNFHHSPDDTFDKVDPGQLEQNVAAWTAMLSVVANAREAILPATAASGGKGMGGHHR